MGCVKDDGSIGTSGRKILEALKTPMTPEAIANASGVPLFKVRIALREMSEIGFVSESNEIFKATEAGLQKLS